MSTILGIHNFGFSCLSDIIHLTFTLISFFIDQIKFFMIIKVGFLDTERKLLIDQLYLVYGIDVVSCTIVCQGLSDLDCIHVRCNLYKKENRT